MPKLVFKIEANYERVIKLREEIAKLKSELQEMNSSQPQFNVLNKQLQQSTTELKGLTQSAAQAGAEMDNGLKKKIFGASQSVNDLTDKIIKQKSAIGNLQSTIRQNKELYRTITSKGNDDTLLLNKIREQEKALGKEKDALFKLTQQQAQARLSVKKLKDEYALFNNESKQTVDQTNLLEASMKKAFLKLGGTYAIKELIGNIVKVRGEFQSMQQQMDTLVGKDTAGKLMFQIKEMAKISPLTMQDMVGAEKMMLSFNINAQDTVKYLQALSDISMGDSQRFNSLTLAFSQMSAAGKLMGQDLNQMINAGFNPLQSMADKTGKSIGQLRDEMSKGAISAEMVQQAFIDVTSEGGKFYKMSEEGSKTINGQISMMQDAIDTAFDEIGSKSEGLIMKGVQGTTSLIKNYETVGKVLAGLVAIYGTYRTALILNTVIEQGFTKAIWAKVTATKAATIAQTTFNKVMLLNPYVAVGAGIVSLGVAMWALSDSTTAAEKAMASFNKRKDDLKKKEEEHKETLEKLVETMNSEVAAEDDRLKAMKTMENEYPSLFKKYVDEKGHITDLIGLWKEYNNEASKRNKDNKQQTVEQIDAEIKGAEWAYKLAEKENNRSEMKQQADRLEALKKERAKWVKEVLADINEELNKPESKTTTYQADYDKAKKDWETSKKALSAIEKDKKKYTSKQYEDAKKDVETKEKAYKKLGGKTGNALTKEESAAEKLRKENDKYNILLGKQSLDEKRTIEDMQMKIDEARIKSMAEGSDKVIAEMELNFEKEMQAIDRQKEDLLRTKIENARSAFEANPKNKKRTFDSSGISLSDDENKAFDELYKASIINFEKIVREQQNKERKSWNDYLKEFGDIQERRKAIIEDYNDRIAKATTKGEKATLIKQMANELDEFDKKVKNSANLMGKLFSDSAEKSVKEIQSIIDKVKLLLEYLEAEKDAEGNAIINGKTVSKADMNKMGVSNNTLSNLEQSPEQIESLKNGLDGLYSSLKSKSPFILFKDQVKDAMNLFKKGGSDNTANGIQNLSIAFSQFAPQVKQFGNSLGTIFGDDGLGQKISGITDGIDGLGTTAAGVGQIMLGDVVGGAMSVVNGISQVVNALDGMFGADYSQYNKMKEEYEQLSDVWDRLIEKKQKYIDISYGDEARKAAQESIDLYNKEIQSNISLGIERLNSGASAGSHSIGVRQRKNISSQGWSELAKAAKDIGFNYDSVAGGRMEGLFSLSADQISQLQEQAPTFWAKLDGDVKNYLQKIIDCNDSIEDMKESLNETFNGISFDTFYDNFVSKLSDMDKDSKDMADDFGEYLKNAMLENLVANKYREKIQALYDDWTNKSDSDGDGIYDLTANESQQLKDAQKALAEQIIAERDAMAQAYGWTSSYSQEASKNAFGTEMTHEDAGELSGRFTAMHEEEVKQNVTLTLINATTADIKVVNTSIRDIADDARNIMANSYLELVSIRENTEAVIKPIKQIATDIAEVKSNTSKL